jgi:flagellin
MGLRIATNVQSLAAQRYLQNNQTAQAAAFEKLASGSRINKAGDDAAGLAISEKLRANVRSLAQASRNANDGISLIQTTEGALNEVSNILVRLRELSIQAASDTIGDTERGFVDKEVQHLKQEINRIAAKTEFNGYKTLKGDAAPIDIQIGTNNNPFEDRLTIDTKELVTNLDSLHIGEMNTMSTKSAQEALDPLDQALVTVNGYRANLGALQNRLSSTINNLAIYRENLETAKSRVKDTDMAVETTEMSKANILSQANVSVLAQANNSAGLALKLLG